jgi:hypothetical protein
MLFIPIFTASLKTDNIHSQSFWSISKDQFKLARYRARESFLLCLLSRTNFCFLVDVARVRSFGFNSTVLWSDSPKGGLISGCEKNLAMLERIKSRVAWPLVGDLTNCFKLKWRCRWLKSPSTISPQLGNVDSAADKLWKRWLVISWESAPYGW